MLQEQYDQNVKPSSVIATHTVFNQVPPLIDYDLFAMDQVLTDYMARLNISWADEHLHSFGQRMGQAEVQEWAVEMNRQEPVLRTHDRSGQRIDEVAFTPAWHHFMRESISAGVHALSWREEQAGSYAVRAALFYMSAQIEAGHGCPLSMTHAAYPVLKAHLPAVDEWSTKLTAMTYEPGLRPIVEKQGLLCGMGMTEKQGGSDVRANTTKAVRSSEQIAGETVYLLTGHKWFCSAPMCDLFLVLAQAPGGLSCFLLPRVLPDGTRNVFMLQRLKDKLGNRSNASSEVEFAQTQAILVGAEGRGVRTIIEMVNATRLDCILGSAALMRQALVQALHHTSHRRAFGRRLIQQPLMRSVLADMALESVAATLLGLHLATASERAGHDADAAFLKRLGTAVGKYWVTKRTPVLVAEALECLGGNGYVEESMLPRLYREAPLNSIWEGSGNVNCLDVLRSLASDAHAVEHFAQIVAPALPLNSQLEVAATRLFHELQHIQDPEWSARRLVEQMALVLQGTLLVLYAPSAIADAFCATRLGLDWGHTFGSLPTGLDSDAILRYVWPRL